MQKGDYTFVYHRVRPSLFLLSLFLPFFVSLLSSLEVEISHMHTWNRTMKQHTTPFHHWDGLPSIGDMIWPRLTSLKLVLWTKRNLKVSILSGFCVFVFLCFCVLPIWFFSFLYIHDHKRQTIEKHTETDERVYAYYSDHLHRWKDTPVFHDFPPLTDQSDTNNTNSNTNSNKKPLPSISSTIFKGHHPFDSKVDTMLHIWLGCGQVTSAAHYDAVHNVYVQLYGKKRFVLMSPFAIRALYAYPRYVAACLSILFLCLYVHSLSLSLSLSFSLTNIIKIRIAQNPPQLSTNPSQLHPSQLRPTSAALDHDWKLS